MSEWPRPCPIPGHPHDDDGEPVVITESAWARLRAWHLHAPAERLPLPAVLVTWPAAWIMHWLQVPVRAVAWTAAAVTVVTWLAWAWRHRRARKTRQTSPDSQHDAGTGPVLADRGGAGRSSLGRVVHRRRRVRPHRPAGPVADPGLPGRGGRRVLVAAQARGGPRRPPAPRRPGRRPRRQEAVASDPAPHRAGRLACAMAARHQPR